MRFIAALDTRIYGVPYAQGAEVNITGWSRKQMLQFLGNGIIQASALTVGTITDLMDFVGNGVTYEIDAEGTFIVTIDPALAGLSDVDMTIPPEDAQALTWSAALNAWKASDIATALAQLTDVDVTTTPPVDGSSLEYDIALTKWVTGPVHSPDAYLLDRTHHTGEQAMSTVTGLEAVLDDLAASGGIFKGAWYGFTGAEAVYDSQVITSAGDLAGIGASVGGPNSYPAPDAAGTPPAQSTVLQIGTPSTGSGNFNLTVPAGVTKVRWRARVWLNGTWTVNQEMRLNGVVTQTYGMGNWGWYEYNVTPGDGFTLNTQGSFGTWWGYWQIAEVELVGPEIKLWSLGDYVTHENALYRSTADNNATTPGADGADWVPEVSGGGAGGGGSVGGGFANTYLGESAIGATWTTVTQYRTYHKQIVVPGPGAYIAGIEAYIDNQGTPGSVLQANVFINEHDPSGGTTDQVGKVVASNYAGQFYLARATEARWVTVPVGKYLEAGTYWIGIQFHNAAARLNIGVPGAGTDRVITPAGLWSTDGIKAGSGYPISTAANVSWAMRASVLVAGTAAYAGVKVRTAGGQVIASPSTFTPLTWDIEDWDTDGYHSLTTNTSRFTVPAGKAGKYAVHARYHYETGSAQNFIIAIVHNGADLPHTWTRDGSQSYPGIETNTELDLAVGDYIEVAYYGPSGTMNSRAEFSMHLIGGAVVLTGGGDLRWATPTGVVTVDEFDDNSLNAAWVRVDGTGALPGTVSWVESADVLSMQHTAAADSAATFHALMRPLASAGGDMAAGDAFITCLTLFGQPSAQYTMGGIMIADGITHGAGKQVMSLNFTGSGQQAGSVRSFTGYNAMVAQETERYWPFGVRTFVRVVMLAANSWRLDLSPDGVQWMKGNPLAYTMTPTHVGLHTSSWGGAVPSIVSYEFLRRQAGVT